MTKALSYLNTKRGILAAVWSEKGLYELTFPFPTKAEAFAKVRTQDASEQSMIPGLTEWQARLTAELEAYFRGVPTKFSVPVDWSHYPDFRVKALRFCAEIPFGQVATYGGIAAAIGSPAASRAIGGAMHANRTPIVVPCHRVVGSGGKLTGFGGGLELKEELLGLEKDK